MTSRRGRKAGARGRSPSRRRGWRWIPRVLAGALVLLLLLVGGLWVGYELFIVRNPGEEISRERIQRIFTLQSPVYYDDGVTVLGVFFQEEHRQYVPYDRLPKHFVLALVAAEDKNFFSHPGFDPGGILRAIYLNLRAGRVVQGGSTITQQAAKNLFKRQRRSFRAKFVELVRALKLEAHYSKEQILEWYANQFFVTGNGVGVGIAAQYFFNKPVEKLTLLECAFLAGCVKAPNRYNPFIQRSEEARRQALARAKDRTHYVLNNMLALGFIDRGQYEAAIREEIPFKQGKIRYALNSVLDAVRDRLGRPEIQAALAEAGIDNIATSGVRIYTSVRKELQAAAFSALRENLSALETKLTGYKRENVLERYSRLMASEDEVDRTEFMFGKVKKVRPQKEGHYLEVELPGGKSGLVDEEGLKPILLALVQGMRGAWATPKKGDEALILREIQEGDPVFVRVRGPDKEGRTLLALEQYPELNGAVLAVQDGFIRAMVGGVDNIHFNRALDARRQVGSVFKPLVYMAALQLGWSNLDPLRNRWAAFLYQGRIYIPHPDHESPYEWVSMTWAGTKSENIATVWLLYHLCDRLNLAQLKELAQTLDMAPRPGESRGRFVQRIRDKMGIMVTRDSLLHTAFEMAKEELRTDLIFGGREEELASLEDLHYGLGVERYLKENPRLADSSAGSVFREREARTLHHNFLRLRAMQEEMRNDYEVLRWALHQPEPSSRLSLALQGRGGFYWQSQPSGERLVYTRGAPGRDTVPVDPQWILSRMREGADLKDIIQPSKIWVDGALPAAILDQLQEGIQRHLAALRQQDPYDLEVLCRLRDFKIAMALRYVAMLGRRLGISSPLDPVLSLPLGANSITMEDACRMYYALITGNVFSSGMDTEESATFLITRIEGPEGEILFEASPEPRRLLEREHSDQTAEILRKVISNGTGHQAEGALSLTGTRHEAALRRLRIKIPALGKTGTSDEYRNSSFVGFIPGVAAGGSSLTLENGVALAVYVGYDDNRPMKSPRIRVYGAAGALPIWISVAQAAVRYLGYEDRVDLVDLAFRPGAGLNIEWPADAVEVPVDAGNGLPVAEGSKAVLVRTYGELNAGGVDLRRSFRPLKKAEKVT